jgi:ABC-2 type transport system permease protein/lipopolysaccharide transport system permease protein
MVEPSSASGASLGVAGPPVHPEETTGSVDVVPATGTPPEPITHSLDTLYVPDLSTLPEEPPEESLYEHKAGLLHSAKLVWEHREIIHTLAERDFKAQYKQATLGILWAVVAPVTTLFVLVIVFSRVKRFNTGGIPFALYAFVGIMCWSFFASSLSSGGTSLLNNKALLSKTQFPRECFPLESMAVNAINTVLSLIPLTILFVFFGRAPAITSVWVPIFIVIELVFAAGVTLAVAGLIIQARDLAQVLPIVISLGIFATPVIWPFTLLPTHYHVAGGHLVRHVYHGHLGAGHYVGGFYINLQAV